MDVYVLDQHGQKLPLYSLWRDSLTVVALLRHFGCRFCKQQLSDLQSIQSDLEKADAHLVVISIGKVEQIADFKKSHNFTGAVYVDEGQDNIAPVVYSILRLRRGVEYVRNEKTKAVGAKAAEAGFVDGGFPSEESPYTGDVTQIGGVFILGPGNSCDYAYRSQYAGDHPPAKDILTVVQGLVNVQTTDHVFEGTRAWVSRLGADKPAKPAPKKEVITKPKEKKAPTATTQQQQQRLPISKPLIVFGMVIINLGALFGAYRDLGTPDQWGSLLTTLGALVVSAHVARELFNKKAAPKRDFQFLTSRQVDELTMNVGSITCDCGSVKDNLQVDVLSKGDLEPRRSLRVSDPNLDDTIRRLRPLQVMNCYVREFLGKPHPLVGRKGTTCPFVPVALKQDALYFSVVDVDPDVEASEMRDIVFDCIQQYAHLSPTKGKQAMNKAIIMIFPRIPLSRAPEVIDKTQLDLKPEVVKRGLMLGEFHLNNNCPGLRNKNFYPLRTPYPCLAIRQMVASDIVFLNPETYSPQLRIQFLEAFVNRFKGSGPDKELDVANEALAKARAEL